PPGAGPRIRSDIVEGYLVRREPPEGETSVPRARTRNGAFDPSHFASPTECSLLQLHRARDPLKHSWQPVLGHAHQGATAVPAALREAREEAGLDRRDKAWVGMWALEQLHPFFVAEIDCVVLSPRFVIEVAEGWEPTINDEHDTYRWVHASQAWRRFMWP